MGTTFYQALPGEGYATAEHEVEVSLSSARFILEKLGLETDGPQGTVGTIHHRDIPKYLMALSSAMFSERDPNRYVMDRWTRLQRLFVAAYYSNRDIGWS